MAVFVLFNYKLFIKITQGLKWQLKEIEKINFKNKNQNIVIVGDVATGKTSLAAHISRNAIENVSSLAQEESRNISENVTWGQRKRFADGKINLPYKRFLGYEKGEDGLPKVVESEAKIVRKIYNCFITKEKLLHTSQTISLNIKSLLLQIKKCGSQAL